MLGKFITFEGGEGGGKSTQSKLLVAAIKENGIQVMHTREPGGTDGAEAIRELLVTGEINKWDAITETFLHLAARRDHVEKMIRPALEAGTFIVCDRFSDSTMAYQGYGHGLGRPFIAKLQNMTIGTFEPDLTIILDVTTDLGMRRAGARSSREDRYEKMGIEFHEQVRKGFRDTAKQEPARCVVLEANDTIENIHRQILDVVNRRLRMSLKIK
jgi:dTMP kinase